MDMKQKAILLLIVISSQIIFTSCATVFTGSRQNVTIDSDVPDTRVEVGGMYQGTTPTSVRLKKGFTGETVVLKKEGYEHKVIQPPTEFNPVSIINLFNVLFWAIDVATGAVMKYSPDYIQVKMEPKKDN
jgi:hypothetical protein